MGKETEMGNELNIGDKAPDFILTADDGRQVSLDDFRGKNVVLYFYPQDMSPTCTDQACQFRDRTAEFERLGAAVVGISPDKPERHARFRGKYGLPFVLLSDPDHAVAETYGTWQLKKLYGREYMGIVRSTFLIDKKGNLAAIWRNVRLKGHLDDVLAELERLADKG
jgi:peroxiredoxin Q/BCP